MPPTAHSDTSPRDLSTARQVPRSQRLGLDPYDSGDPMTFLPRQICPLCSSDEYITEVEGPGLWRLTCTEGSTRDHPFSWVTTAQGPFDHTAQDGISAELGLYNDLLGVVRRNGPWLEYGIVEYHYAVAHPVTYSRIVKDYGHVALAPKPYTASSLIGAALGKLRRDGDLVYRPCKATGRWSYNSEISAWATAPGPSEPALLTWTDFAEQQGFSPECWPPLDA
jgi:hypothetical protein